MTAEQQAGAFRSLLQTTKKRGTGIGLAIVSKIIEAHHGTISVSSVPNSGTTFRILIPHS
jgi:signal transduction histidine kinase